MFSPTPKAGLSAAAFYSDVLYPTSQPLGRSYEMPFERVMEEITASPLNSKFVILTINASQYRGNDNYWPNEFNRWGFQLTTKTKNSIGDVNYIYTRNPSVVAINDGEH